MIPLKFIPLIILIACSSKQKKSDIEIVDAFPNLTFELPVDIQASNDNTNRLFVLSQSGVVYVFKNNPKINTKKIFLDIKEKVLSGGEMGLLGLAFHPNYDQNGYFYLNYIKDNPRRTVIARYEVSGDNSFKANKESEVILLEVNQPHSNHNGGQIIFGPDGYLYVSFGDGGSAGDPLNSGQDLSTLLGCIIRIDVDTKSEGRNYDIPQDNPFKRNDAGYREEIYAYGLRNVWRFSFDKDGRLWAADVGQNKWEEINIIEKGNNYGWRIMEGYHCYNPEKDCDTSGLQLPIWEYGHNSEGGFSITGGFFYNGKNASKLLNKYIYADYVSGKIWTLDLINGKVFNKLLMETDFAVSTFGLDEQNELYFADYQNDGKLYKFFNAAMELIK
jgi:glucose/arabinose dehydrogenase